MNGRVWSTLIGALLGALLTGFVSMTVFGRQLASVEAKVTANGKGIDEVKLGLRDHRLLEHSK